MKILAVDTSQIRAAVALVDTEASEHLIDGREGQVSVAHSEALLPLIDDLLHANTTKPDAFDAFAAGVGPGSFTGVRVGCATVKALAQVCKKPVLAFSSLRALWLSVWRADDPDGKVAMVNAYQKQVFAGWIDEATKKWTEQAVAVEQWCREHKTDSHANFEFCGTGVRVYRQQITQELEARDAVFREDVPFVTVHGVSKAVLERLAGDDASKVLMAYSKLAANYMRPSAAEMFASQKHPC